MSRSVRGSKGCGYEYWGKRPYNGVTPNRENKKIALGIERAMERKMVYDELQELENEVEYAEIERSNNSSV